MINLVLGLLVLAVVVGGPLALYGYIKSLRRKNAELLESVLPSEFEPTVVSSEQKYVRTPEGNKLVETKEYLSDGTTRTLPQMTIDEFTGLPRPVEPTVVSTEYKYVRNDQGIKRVAIQLLSDGTTREVKDN